MYSPRRRKVYSKKYYRNRLFAPSIPKANMPNYYQMKGRIIQQTPSKIKEPVTDLMTSEKLKKMYDTLIRFKYISGSSPSPSPTPTPFDPTPYTFTYDTTPILFSNLTDTFEFDQAYFNTILINTEKPDPPAGYSYHFDVIQLFFEAGPVSSDTSLFSVTWDTQLVTNLPVYFFRKTASSTLSTTYYATCMCVPRENGKCTVFVSNVSANTLSPSANQYNSSVALDVSGIPYPIVTSDTTSEAYGSKIVFTRTASGNQDKYCIYFRFLAYLKAD